MLGYKHFNFWLWLVLIFLFVGTFLVVAVIPNPKAVSASSSLTLQPGAEGKDAYVFAMSPDTNFGNATELWVADCGPPACARSFLQFDLSSVPSNVTITSANLELYYSSWFGLNDTSSNLPVSRLIGSWDEASVTWNNQPTIDGSPIGTMAVSSGQYGWKSVDIKNQLVGWLSGSQPNYGLTVSYETPPAQNGKKFYSTDYTDANLRPKLIITYQTTDVPPVVGGETNDNNKPPAVQPPAGIIDETSTTTPSITPSITPTETTSDAGSQTSKTAVAVNAVSWPLIKGVVDNLSNNALATILLGLAGLLSLVATLLILIQSLATGFSLKEFAVMTLNIIFSVFSFKKHNKSGRVYDQTSNKPLAGAIVLIYRLPEIKLVAVKTTDNEGNFIFPVEAGKYAISVKKRGFLFPSNLAKGEGVYLGQTLNLNEKSIINVKIPLDPTPKMKSKPSVLRLIFFSTVVRFTILLSGTALSILTLLYYPGLKTYLILSGYGLIWLIEYLIQSRVIKFSIILDRWDNKPVDLAILRIIDQKGKIVQTFVSDDKGYLIPYAKRKNYRISIERVGYKKLEEEAKISGFIEHRTFGMEKY